MSTLTADPPFSRGHTLGEGVKVYPPEFGDRWVGVEKVFTDVHAVSGDFLSNMAVRCVALRNKSGAPLLPGQVVNHLVGEVDALAAAGDPLTAVVDEYIPASGVKEEDVFWAVINGPTSAVCAAAAKGDTLGVGAGDAVAGTGLGVAIADAVDGKVRLVVGVAQLSASNG